jgi:putative ABC transport system substrate-binding protein
MMLACGWTTWPCIARAGESKVYRIGYLHPTDPSDVAYPAFVRALKNRGYVAGGNAVVEERFAYDQVERLPAMAAELVSIGVDVIVAVSPAAIRAARAATRKIPIVMAFSGDDPVKSGFAAALARPGGNTTGLTAMTLDIVPKRLQLLAELAPGLRTVAVLRSPGRADHTAQVAVLEVAANLLGIRLQTVEARGVDQYAQAFASMAAAGCQALIVLSGPEFTLHRHRLVELTAQYRLPDAYQYSEFVVIGGLVSYGPDIVDLSSRAADYVDKILKGADPAELPIEQPRKLYLAINRRSANRLGLNVSPALLLQADKVIQ